MPNTTTSISQRPISAGDLCATASFEAYQIGATLTSCRITFTVDTPMSGRYVRSGGQVLKFRRM